MTVAPSSIGDDRTSSPTPVLVTQRADRVWIAKLLTWAGFSVEGDSREDALLKLDQQVKAQLAKGEIAYLDLPLVQTKNPWLAIAGKYQDCPMERIPNSHRRSPTNSHKSEGIELEGNDAQ
jgi:hypothetical protein